MRAAWAVLEVAVVTQFLVVTYVAVAVAGFSISERVKELKFPESKGKTSVAIGMMLGYFVMIWMLSIRPTVKLCSCLTRSLVRTGLSWDRKAVRWFAFAAVLYLVPLGMAAYIFLNRLRY